MAAKIERIRVREIDNSLELLQPARTVEIRTDRGSTVTPGRCVTGYEFNRKSQVPSIIPITNPVSVYGKLVTGRDMDNLLNSNSWFGQQVRRLEKAARITEYSVLHVPVFELARTSSSGPSPAEILRSEKNRTRFLKQMIALQADAGYGIMSVPHLDLPLGDAKKIMRQADGAIRKLGGQPPFSADVRRPGFNEIVDYLAEDLQANLINLRYGKRRDFSQAYLRAQPAHVGGRPSNGKRRDFSQAYLHLEKMAGRDVAFLMTGVARADHDHGDLSTMHYMPFLGNDLFAVEAPRPAISESKTTNTANLKALHRDELTILPVTDPRMSDLDVLDVAGNPVSEDLRLRNVKEAEHDAEKYAVINAITCIQDLLGSTAEFSEMAAHVRERSSRDYVRGKKGLESKLRGM